MLTMMQHQRTLIYATLCLCCIVFCFKKTPLLFQSAGLLQGVQDDQLYTSNRGHCVTRSCVGDTLWGQRVHVKGMD